ncbi:MAG: His-Xaa-Ser system protein HxsD [Treponema sp.]|nr:His-Xaa-Ser system protein HxsD [Treponema sp.]
MIEAKQIANNAFIFTIDSSIFSEVVLSKALYWYADTFNVFWQQKNNKHIVKLVCKSLSKYSYTFTEITDKLNQDLIDYKNRIIIAEETKNIRDILYIKAFANNDEFEDIILK